MPDYKENLDSCLQLFLSRGLRSVSIEDITRNCQLSKKEIYDVFENKEGVIRAALLQDIAYANTTYATAVAQSQNAIEELLMVHTKIMNRVSKIKPILFFDLNKFYTEIGVEHIKMKEESNYAYIMNNILRGINEKIYRVDIDKDIVAKLWISKFDIIRAQKLFPLDEYDLKKLASQFIELHLRSIANQNGLKLLDQYFSIEQV